MNDGQLKFPAWQLPLQEFILRPNGDRTNEKVNEVEALLVARLRQLRETTEDHAEEQAIGDAVSLLRTIKRDKLGFPDWT